ncbi:hypothetical protein HAZT_HAZT002994 [Hyalella azteca]|uniref:Uncharacterized protein LOC108673436 n=1 Tax=Hyalella azteca TaxID=294128 RepID=A0A6A0GQC1_HYAAZ|nr:uncharacterized protein LOC108673436 [Hyalella azteca]XP_018016757.1 uncharacterized protein LOC108673436 [Hyalella azteca]XP_047741395.1 uncharacterized protein LOC108673436 [Hyalella azteca]XP_047741396.1 uncharacterized protein LOC108673436 [Hyalella azteca]KAA0183279.1 hypothetical protein HAZT_HAZT002994 [Hyalella azteca]
MPQHHTTGDQVQFVGEWFSSWSELQRSDFLTSLLQELRPSHHINGGLPERLGHLAIAAPASASSSRPPSIFNCQVKLFHDWVGGWSAEERAKLLTSLRETDSSFGQSLDAALAALDGDAPAAPREDPEGVEVPQPVPDPIPEGDLVNAAPPAEAPVPAARALVGHAAGADSDVDEALDSSPPSTLSSPNPGDGRADSGLDSPAEPEGEDEGGHVVIVDEQEVALAAVGHENIERVGDEGDGIPN